MAMSIETFASVNPWAMLDMDTVGAGEASLGVLGDGNSPQLCFLSLSFPGSWSLLIQMEKAANNEGSRACPLFRESHESLGIRGLERSDRGLRLCWNSRCLT